jgi:hypothetical protein
MAALVAAIHFPEAERSLHRFWKMGGRDKPGHDGYGGVMRRSIRANSALAAVVVSTGALALGAFAIGAFAIGALAIGRVAVGKARIKRLEIDELVVRKLTVLEK